MQRQKVNWLIHSSGLFLACLLPLATALGCGEGADRRPTASIRDSAGIRIVENATPLWHEEETWRLSADPITEIGNTPGDPNHDLYQVRDAVRLEDGRIVVANGGSKELRFYDASGAHVQTVGGVGGGPGEFNELRWMQQVDDSLIAYDPFPPRLLFFDLRGNYARSFLFQAAKDNVYPLPRALFDDGSILANLATFDPNDRPEGLIRRPVTYARYNEAGTGDTLGSFPGSEMYAQRFGQSGRSFTTPFFQRFTYVFPYATGFSTATNDAYEIRLYSRTGTLESIIRKDHVNLEVQQSDVDFLRDHYMGLTSDENARARIESTLQGMPVPETMPAFGWSRLPSGPPVIADDEENIWVIDYSHPADERIRWSVFDPGGQWLGVVDFPMRIEPLHIGDDFLLGLVRDEFDVERVRLYELIKPAT